MGTSKNDYDADIVASVEQQLHAEERQTKKLLADTRMALANVSLTPKAVTFRVLLTSMWAEVGEHSAEATGKGPLVRVIRRAEARFCKLNNRRDLQANYVVHAVIGDRKNPYRAIPVHKQFVDRLRRKV